jgi:hypothetical protein
MDLAFGVNVLGFGKNRVSYRMKLFRYRGENMPLKKGPKP